MPDDSSTVDPIDRAGQLPRVDLSGLFEPRMRVRDAVPVVGLHALVWMLQPHGRRPQPESSEEAVRLRNAWAASTERSAAYRRLWVYASLLALLAVGLTVSLFLWERDLYSHRVTTSPPSPWWLYSLMIWITLGLADALIYPSVYHRAMDRLDDRLREAALQRAEEKVATSAEELSLHALWALTQQRIDHYHRLATSQSTTSFRIGQAIMILGFVAVVALGIFAASATNGTAAIAASVVAVAGAALSGFVGATFMRSQSEASSQLREFFLQPVEFSRLLGAERLIQLLKEDAAKERAIEHIIQATARPSADRSEEARR